MKLAALIFPMLLMAVSPAIASEQRISGTAKAIDGDTLAFPNVRVRLIGIDAPEAKQDCLKDQQNWQCGQEARALLARLIQGQQIECRSSGEDVYGRLLAKCSRQGLDLGLTMIEAGMAVTVANSPQSYVRAEEIQQAHKTGIWATTFERPSKWRAANSAPQQVVEPVQTPTRRARPPSFQIERTYRNQFGCAIKGNRNRRGEWIYHLPGRPYYNQTRPEELFCTEAEAIRAGYRRSKA
ncbi:thermonuclease family protein [Sphingomonadaceae bacterium]|nr:thermonuclease family protein [Sphingomonadaceae bacterium]